MIKPNKYIDIFLLTLLAFLIILGLYRYFADGAVVYLNNILAAVSLVYGIILKIKNSNRGRYVVITLLLLSTVGILNYIVSMIARVGSSSTDTFSFIQYPGIDPLTLPILIIYCVINRSFFWECYSLLFHGSKEYRQSESDKKVDFYYKKFTESTDEELVRIYSMYNEYPVEAQVALQNIKQERNLDVI